MFTGIVSAKGQVKSLQRRGDMALLTLALGPRDRPFSIGESIAVNGVCLTLTTFAGDSVTFDLSAETLARSTLGGLLPKDWVNVERSLRLGDPLGGHWVLGHVDGVGKVIRREQQGEKLLLSFEVPSPVQEYAVFKGSIAVEGVSLTIAQLQPEGFSVALIPHTAGETTLGNKRVGDKVNLEADVIGKYVKKFLSGKELPPREVTPGLLKEHGFL